MALPLEGITVLEFSQYLAGPYAGLRLADLGARVIKIERPRVGDACRQLAIKHLFVDGDSLLFHTINRNKESYAANLKDPEDLAKVKALVKHADVITHNFRPGVMDKIGLDYQTVRQLNPTIVYGEVSGYGKTGPWVNKPGQDLLAQSVSGLAWLSGNDSPDPTPFGFAIADMICGTHLAQGLLAALVRRQQQGIGALVEVSLLESILDFQFEGITTYLNNGEQLPKRSQVAGAHTLLEAPYGVYQTADGYLAIAMTDLGQLLELLECNVTSEQLSQPYEQRDAIKAAIQRRLVARSTDHWLTTLEAADIWCSDVYTYATLMNQKAYQQLDMDLTVSRPNGASVTTTRCPIQLNGDKLRSDVAAPALGNANEQLASEGLLDD
ncbi:CoA transferase [Neiella sp. HB171785]|uniref:CoA transferase n=1 Tax=Neiella litorisoli TaxID=2771431 RepID=A0A8J6QJE5_9GAMM|nr:CaiB/BaiF CoA-transferase family protein [Neiella litorisoli]MBD1390143.1 CoA transferase [Neiella litorisoli]